MTTSMIPVPLEDIVGRICPICKSQVVLETGDFIITPSQWQQPNNTLHLKTDSIEVDVSIPSGRIIQYREQSNYQEIFCLNSSRSYQLLASSYPQAIFYSHCYDRSRNLLDDSSDIHCYFSYTTDLYQTKTIDNQHYIGDIYLEYETIIVGDMRIGNSFSSDPTTYISFSNKNALPRGSSQWPPNNDKVFTLPYIAPNYNDISKTVEKIKTLITFS